MSAEKPVQDSRVLGPRTALADVAFGSWLCSTSASLASRALRWSDAASKTRIPKIIVHSIQVGASPVCVRFCRRESLRESRLIDPRIRQWANYSTGKVISLTLPNINAVAERECAMSESQGACRKGGTEMFPQKLAEALGLRPN